MYRASLPVLSTFLFSSVIFAQFLESAPSRRTETNPMTTVLMGRVAADSGSAPPERTDVILDCGNAVRARAYSDAKGNFSLNLSVVDSDSPFLEQQGQAIAAVSDREWSNCELYGELGGYQSQHIRLMGIGSHGMFEVGTIVLHPLQKADGEVVSASALAAPKAAQDAVAQGKDQEKKGRWAAAADYFKKAVAAYPRYALAWVELGRVQIKQNDYQEAEQSLQQAVSHDSGFLPAYAELAHVAAIQKQWKELADVTSRLVAAAPEASPEYWLMNSAANYNLGRLTEAKSSVERGLRLDPKHSFPQMEYLYGVILARERDFKSAIQHISSYLQLNPKAPDSQNAQLLLSECQKQDQ
jgi:tetratricopeptide (TPR) repeat protein